MRDENVADVAREDGSLAGVYAALAADWWGSERHRPDPVVIRRRPGELACYILGSREASSPK